MEEEQIGPIGPIGPMDQSLDKVIENIFGFSSLGYNILK